MKWWPPSQFSKQDMVTNTRHKIFGKPEVESSLFNLSLFLSIILLLSACNSPDGPAPSQRNKNTNLTSHLMLTDRQMRLANITTQKVTRRAVGQTVVINGRIVVDKQKSEVISSRIAGRVEKLFVKETGQTINRGQPLYTLYSEELLTLQQEYLLAREQYEALGQTEKRYKSFLEASERKLLLYGLTKDQIGRLTRNSLQPRMTFLAPSAGVATEINVTEGQYVGEGAVLYKTEDMSSLWVEAELYPHETSLIKVGDRVTVKTGGTEERPIDARVTFLSPEYRDNTQIVTMRASINNPDQTYKPGQFVQVFLTHSSRESLVLPVDAVIRDEHGAHVYVQEGRHTFRPQIVKTGIENFDFVEITDGIQTGDTVAVSGAYLLYSEIILKKGTNPIAGPHH